MRFWLGGAPAESRRAQWGRDGKISMMLLYLLAMAGMVIVFLVLLLACRPAEPDPDTLPSNPPSQRYFTGQRMPEPECRCASREPIDPTLSTEDPRLLP